MKDFQILLTNGDIIMHCIIGAIFLLLLPTIICTFLILPASSNIMKKISLTREIESAATSLDLLDNRVSDILQFLAIVVVLSGLTTSLMGSSIKATIRVEGFDIFPTEISYAYGLQFTLFLAVLYFPVHFYLAEQKKLLLKNLPGRNEVWKSSIAGKLSRKTSALDMLKASLTVLSPLIASFLPQHLATFK
jgi:hypothetical protein